MKSDCTEHKTHIEHYASHKDLAEAIGNLRYDSLIELFEELFHKFHKDAMADGKRGRVKLSMGLHLISMGFVYLKTCMAHIWEICKPYMKK